jgi:hypothetical protein
MTEAQGNGGLSRRTVVKAAAWSIPVMAIGSNAPAFALSPIFTLTGLGCKLPGNSNDLYKGYAFGVTLNNPTQQEIKVTITSLTLNTTNLGDVLFVQTSKTNASTCATIGLNTFTLQPGQTLTDVVALTENAANSANGTLTVSYTVDPASAGGGNVSASVNAAPPINGGSCRDFTQQQKQCLRTVQGAPTITSIAPTSGPVGTLVQLTGTNFLGTTEVTFAGVSVPFVVNAQGTNISFTVPNGASLGSNAVVVFAAGTAQTTFTVT